MHPLRRARERRNLSQQALADLCGLGIATVERAERGRPVRPDTRQRLCVYFGMPASELGLISDICQDNEADGMNRRQALQALLGVAGTTLFLHDAPTSISEAISRPVIDATVLPSLQVMTQSYWQLRAHLATPDLQPAVIEHFNTLMRLLRTYSMTPSVCEQLCTLTGEVAQIVGVIAYDNGKSVDALAAYRTAIEAASEAGDVALHATALGRLTLLYNHLHDHISAMATIQEAVLRAGTGTNTTIRAWLAVVEAETRAHLQDVQGYHRATIRAETLAQRIAADDYSYWCGFDIARLTSYRGTGLVQLNRPSEAIPVLQDALALTAPYAMRRRSTIGVELVTAYVQRHEYDAASVLLGKVRSWAQQANSRVNIQRLDQLEPQLIGAGLH